MADSGREAATRRLARVQDKRGIREPVEALRSEQRVGAALLAGGLAYRLFLWLLPFGLVIAAFASFWVRLSPKSLEDAARSFGLGGVAAHSAITAIEQGSRARWYLLVAGLVLMVWAGIGAVRALRVTARLAWGLQASRLRRALLTSATFTMICTIGLVSGIGASWARHHSSAWGLVATLGDALVYGGLALFALSHLPCPDGARWRILWPGALLIAVGLTGVQVFLAYFLAGRLERAPTLYGTLGASSVVLLVLFAIARLLVSGMFLNAAIRRLRGDERDSRGTAAHAPGQSTDQGDETSSGAHKSGAGAANRAPSAGSRTAAAAWPASSAPERSPAKDDADRFGGNNDRAD